MNSKSPSFYLNNGNSIPKVGLGTSNFPEFKDVLRAAVRTGYRLIDTARIYNNESAIGEVLEELIESKEIKREELFIITKVWNSRKSTVEGDVLESLKALKTSYLGRYFLYFFKS
jgi:diketogulonate reductase-like aldo/keto reductase